MDDAFVEARLLSLIAQRYQEHTVRDLTDYIFANHLFQVVAPALMDFLDAARQEISAYLSDTGRVNTLVAFCVRATKQYTYQRNQFINYPPEYERILHAEYRQVFVELRELLRDATDRADLDARFSALVQRHHQRLRLTLASYCVSAQAVDLLNHPLLQTVTCGEYSAPFQLHLLGLNLADIQEPILDVGCGSAGQLVSFLRDHGLAAFGLDRLAPSGPYFTQSDWFAFDYTQHAWGTVIAHHAVSTHFIHSHAHGTPTEQQYRTLYRTILANLAPGGVFCYAPGVPFFEHEIATSHEYQVTNIPIPTNTPAEIGAVAYATTVTRRNRHGERVGAADAGDSGSIAAG